MNHKSSIIHYDYMVNTPCTRSSPPSQAKDLPHLLDDEVHVIQC